MIVKKLLSAVLCGLPLLFASTATLAENAVAAAVQRLHLSPQQLLSLRDFLGATNHGVAVEASGNGLFVLRDTQSMAYVGEFSLRTDANAALIIDRVGGQAMLDAAREVVVPLRLDAKAVAQAAAALADSQAHSANSETQTALPQQQISGATPTNTRPAAGILQSRGVFFRDGSGYATSVRFSIPAAAGSPALLRVVQRYYALIKSDRKVAWRPATVEVGGDVALAFADLETRYACPAPGPCTIRGKLPTPSNLHTIRWGRQSIAAVPLTLMAQMAPPLQTSSAPDGAPGETAPQMPPEDPTPEPTEPLPDTPQHPSGT
ncbi:MAG TPA: hypothetical protein VGG69_04045 [Rhizomicrobium sp.]|jgi:hypothetical protein